MTPLISAFANPPGCRGRVGAGSRWARFWISVALCAWVVAAQAQVEELDLEAVGQAAEEWARENLDDQTLAALAQPDREQVEKLLAEVKKRFEGDYVLDLALLKSAFESLLAILERHEETLPYAIWLRSRRDYLDVAEQLRRSAKPPAVGPVPNPEPKAEREIWIKKVASRPWPEAAKPLVPVLKPIFASERIPSELVWLAEVESSFDPRARSPEGAVGLYQLMPATARQYGLRTWPLDQRKNPEPSARAAARLLRDLHAKFGEWRLAVAAYNAGEGRVRRLLKSKKAATYDAIATSLPAETQLYVPKVEATVLKREGVSLASLPAPKPRGG